MYVYRPLVACPVCMLYVMRHFIICDIHVNNGNYNIYCYSQSSAKIIKVI